MTIAKTHAMRVLDAHGIAYEVRAYDETGAFHSAEEAAALLGAPRENVYKTLVVLREGTPRAKPLILMTPAGEDVDLRALARAVGEKKLRMATQREAERLTGMTVGGISALALKRPASFEILVDARVKALNVVHISAGMRGIDLALSVADLVELTAARYVDVST